MAKLEIRHYDSTNYKIITNEPIKPTEEHKKLVQEANEQIKERQRKNLDICISASHDIFGQ